MNPATDRTIARLHPHRLRGVTLIELMIVVLIVGILAGIAYPSYQNQVRETRRTDGKTALLDTAQRLERCYTRYNSYNDAGCDVAGDLAGAGFDSAEDWYVITASAINASAFQLLATAQDDQANDTDCGNLILTNTGVQGSQGGTTDPNDCW